jgi:small GTP-binding protein
MSSLSVPHFKVVLLGNTGVGKTSLIDRISKDIFSLTHIPTVGAQFISLEMSIEDSPFVLEVWDTAGQEVFRSLVSFYTRDAKGCFILFDLTKQATFTALPEWFDFIRENAPDAQIVLFGNKKDLLNEREVAAESISEFVNLKKCPFFEGSAKTSLGVRDAFERMSELVFAGTQNQEKSVVVALGDDEKREKKGGCC